MNKKQSGLRQLLVLLLLTFFANNVFAAYAYWCQSDSDLDSVGYGTLISRFNSYCQAGETVIKACSFPFPTPVGSPDPCPAPAAENDNCPTVANADQLDLDADGVGDLCDADIDGDTIPNTTDTDDDNDTIPDASDNCPSNSNADQLNTDGDTEGDVCDTDDDNDGVVDTSDKFPLNAAASIDSDNDGFPNTWNNTCDITCQINSGLTLDNCPTISNPDQLNTDGDSQGNVCDSDDDNDGVIDTIDKFPLDPTESVDTDNDGIGNNADLDDDNDGVLDVSDNCPINSNPDQLDTDGDSQGDVCDSDDDNDGVADASDNCPLISNANQLDSDGDLVGDICDASAYAPTKITSITTGSAHACALTTQDAVKCWGYNLYGQLGDNTTTQRLTPVDVSGLSGGVSAIAAGGYHTCVLTTQGAVKCWGYNFYSQLGDNTTIQRLTPVDVSGLSSGVGAIAAGGHHTCALTIQGGVKCWGNNGNGQLGDNTATQRLTPVDVSGLSSGVSAIAAGYYHTCALTTQGGVKCWGNNGNGQLGDNTTSQRLTPVDVVGLSSGVSAIAAGGNHACALTTQGAVKCWGRNGNGQLGDNTTTQRLTPVDVSGLSSGAIAIAAGGNHTCALTTQGSVKCWGHNAYGQLGDNTTSQRLTPVDVSGLSSGVTAISAAGGDHTCVLMTQGAVKCWGRNGNGQLGDNTATQRLTPVYVTGLSGDSDNDGVINTIDNCPLNVNQDQLDTDHDGLGDVCDLDTDGDGMPNAWELQYGLNPLVNDASGDLDGDGISNLQEYTNGSNPTVFNKALVKNDYVNNKIAGWIWQGVSNGFETESQNWQLTFPLYSTNWGIPNRFYMPTFPDQANWDIVTTGDFNKDGDADILWRNKTTNDWKIWQIQNGTRVAQTNWTDNFDPTHAWTVVGAGDTDKDGDDDVILNNASTGEVMIWEMQNHAVVATHSVGTKAGYVVNRIGDFNKDGDVDLLLRQVGGDALITWEIENSVFVAERALANTGTGFDPVCSGDFDGDGDDDILLINSSTQVEKWFVMEGYTRTSQQFGASNVGFVFKGCGDYDGDGDADMFWQRSADDMNRVVLQQNWGATKQTVYTNPFGGVNPSAAGYGFIYRGNGN